jgi:hypothetical protein
MWFLDCDELNSKYKSYGYVLKFSVFSIHHCAPVGASGMVEYSSSRAWRARLVLRGTVRRRRRDQKGEHHHDVPSCASFLCREPDYLLSGRRWACPEGTAHGSATSRFKSIRVVQHSGHPGRSHPRGSSSWTESSRRITVLSLLTKVTGSSLDGRGREPCLLSCRAACYHASCFCELDRRNSCVPNLSGT